jgi:hypothetical protein
MTGTGRQRQSARSEITFDDLIFQSARSEKPGKSSPTFTANFVYQPLKFHNLAA